MNLDDIGATILDGRTKGIPGTSAPFALRDIAKKNWNVLKEDLPLPLMVLKRSALDHNAAAFSEYLVANGLTLAPHGKTTMTPQIFAEQIASFAAYRRKKGEPLDDENPSWPIRPLGVPA